MDNCYLSLVARLRERERDRLRLSSERRRSRDLKKEVKLRHKYNKFTLTPTCLESILVTRETDSCRPQEDYHVTFRLNVFYRV